MAAICIMHTMCQKYQWYAKSPSISPLKSPEMIVVGRLMQQKIVTNCARGRWTAAKRAADRRSNRTSANLQSIDDRYVFGKWLCTGANSQPGPIVWLLKHLKAHALFKFTFGGESNRFGCGLTFEQLVYILTGARFSQTRAQPWINVQICPHQVSSST